jgi:hypothetical protein
MPRWPRGQNPARYAGSSSRRGLVAGRRIVVPAMQRYSRPVSGVQLQPGQGQTIVSAGGTATVSVGPSGSGTVWYPAQVTVSTTTGLLTGLDTSLCSVYIGPAGTPVTLQGSVFGGNGVLAVALPPLSPGQFLVAVWSNAHPGDVAAVNITGTMDCLSL